MLRFRREVESGLKIIRRRRPFAANVGNNIIEPQVKMLPCVLSNEIRVGRPGVKDDDRIPGIRFAFEAVTS